MGWRLILLLMDLARRAGWGVALLSFFWVALFPGLVESIGAQTAIPFESCTYTGNFGPRLAD